MTASWEREAGLVREDEREKGEESDSTVLSASVTSEEVCCRGRKEEISRCRSLSTPNEIRGNSVGARLAKRARMTNNDKTQMSSVKEILASLGDVHNDHPEKLSLRFRYFKFSCWYVGSSSALSRGES